MKFCLSRLWSLIERRDNWGFLRISYYQKPSLNPFLGMIFGEFLYISSLISSISSSSTKSYWATNTDVENLCYWFSELENNSVWSNTNSSQSFLARTKVLRVVSVSPSKSNSYSSKMCLLLNWSDWVTNLNGFLLSTGWGFPLVISLECLWEKILWTSSSVIVPILISFPALIYSIFIIFNILDASS